MNQLMAFSPFWVVALGLLLLMLSDASAGSPQQGTDEAKAERTSGLSIGTTVVMFTGACFALAMGLVKPGAHAALPQVALDTFSYSTLASSACSAG